MVPPHLPEEAWILPDASGHLAKCIPMCAAVRLEKVRRLSNAIEEIIVSVSM